MAKLLTIGYADFETEHIEDLRARGVFPTIQGNIVVDSEGNVPEISIKCCGLIIVDKEKKQHDFMYHSVKELLQGLIDNRVDRCYFHNLKFDDSFIASYMRNDDIILDGWKVKSKKRLVGSQGRVFSDVLEYTSLKADKNKNHKKFTCNIWDSLKIWNSSLRSLGESFGVYKKGEGHEEALRVGCDERMEEYCLQDCRVMMTAMEFYFEMCNKESEGSHPYGWMTSATTSYNLCMMHIRKYMSTKDFRRAFPPCDEKHGFPVWQREGFKGAVPLLDPSIRNVPIHDVKVFDINSMYPDKLRNYPMPIGYPITIMDKSIDRLMELKSEGKLWVAKVRMVADVKDGHRATYLLKRKSLADETLCSHINDLDGMFSDVESFQVITSVDMDYLLRDYDIRYIEVLDCVGYKTDDNHLLAGFIDKWYDIKEQASINKDKPLKAFAKLILNSLYGKFGANPEHIKSEYVFTDDGIRVRETDEVDIDKFPLYLPIAMFTTAYARDVISKTCNSVGWENVAYTDTDSVHIHRISVDECKKRIENAGFRIHHTDLGAYDFESRWGDALYVRNKGYYHFNGMDVDTGEENGESEIKMAGANGFNGVKGLDDVVGKELKGIQTRGYRVRGGTLLMDKEVLIDTRIDASLKSERKVRGMNHEMSRCELKRREDMVFEMIG